MPRVKTAQNRAYRLAWNKRQRKRWRDEWFAANGPCRHCGSWHRLEVDHINPADKTTRRQVWMLSKIRREAELAKCQPLCHECHLQKTSAQLRTYPPCGTRSSYYHGCRCAECRKARSDYVVDCKQRRRIRQDTSTARHLCNPLLYLVRGLI